MDSETLEALKGSIAKWEAIVAGTGIDQGGINCPLCQKFCAPHLPTRCVGCPVYDATEIKGCEGSPYDDFCNAGDDCDSEDEIDKALKVAAQAELDFLKSLLPVTP